MAGLPAALGAAKTQPSLVVPAETVRPGDTVIVGLQLRMPPGWHTYWRNPGAAGGATKIQWTLPQGVTAGEIQWPLPEKTTTAGLTSYAYEGEVVLMVPLSIANTVPKGPIDLSAKVSWIECETQCIQGKSTVQAKLTIADTAKPSSQAGVIDDWQKKVPRIDSNLKVQSAWQNGKAADERFLTIGWKLRNAEAAADFYPFESSALEIGGETEKLGAGPGEARLRKTVKKFEGDWPKEVEGVIVEAVKGKSSTGYQVKLETDSKPGTAAAGSQTALQPLRKGSSLWGMLGAAFLGGLILNFMPCVLPVIALKILGFVQQSREEPKRVARLGIIYGLGVLFSFLVLAGLIIGVQKAGRVAAWGMQFQNPVFVIIMTTLMVLVALNLFGLFEVNLAGGAMGTASQLATRHGASGAFFNGMLTTALATPCTAPFLASALGYAFVQPPLIIVLFLAFVGLGLAFPYVLLTFQPAWLKFLPKPGAWMETFKKLMGFPVLAAGIWLLSLTVPFYGIDGPLWVGIFLVLLALSAYIYGDFVQRGTKRKGLALVLTVSLLLLGFFAMKLGLVRDEGWQPWSAEAVEKARAQGKPVFVDFTASYCLTCKLNKKTSINTDSVKAKLKEIDAVTLKGDFTLEDPQIAGELQRFERPGVPLNLVYPKDKNKEPIVLPPTLTPSIVLNALNEAAK
jgi:thiol:disulfide interchange protein